MVSPGPTDTELFGQGKTEEEKQRFAQMAALGRLGQPQDIADVVAMLCARGRPLDHRPEHPGQRRHDLMEPLPPKSRFTMRGSSWTWTSSAEMGVDLDHDADDVAQ